ATLVDDGKIDTELLGNGACTYYAANIRRYNHQVVITLADQIIDQDRRAVDVVHRNIEEALNLVGMQVNSQNAVYADDIKHVGHNLGADRYARRARPAVLAGITEIGDNGGDAGGGGATQSVGHHDQFHQIVVGRCAGWLDHEHILAAHIFIEFDT